MKSADANGSTVLQKGLGKVDGAGELIGLHTDKADNAAIGLIDHARNLFREDADVGFIQNGDVEVDVRA